MRLWRGLSDVPVDWGACIATAGVFDGVHCGHQLIVRTALEAARDLRLPLVVITFDPHPDEVVRPGTHPPLLCTIRRRAELLGGLGVDAVCVLPFSYEFSQLGPDEFVRQVVAEGLHATRVVVGDNFRFGHRAKGDVALLGQLGEKYDFTALGVPLLVAGGNTISSSYIRERLAEGDMAAAASALGRPHRVEGVVVRGHQRGRALGFPTANLETPPHTAIPADGVYAGWLSSLALDGSQTDRWPAAISIGTNPTFEAGERTVEAYALDRDDLDLYGAHVAVDFSVLLRPTLKFASVDELITQMHLDVGEARQITAGS
ncbi:MAG: bifunctional riboflavin kinase/FAD synthetase [Streptosporangiaceae bacterium]